MSHTLYDIQWKQAVDRLKHLADLETVETDEDNNNESKQTEKIIDLPREQGYDRFALLCTTDIYKYS